MSMSNIAQLGNLTDDHEGKKTADPKFHHAHIHFIPRYQKAPLFEVDPATGKPDKGRTWPDPQWGMALNIDPKAGLPVVRPCESFISQLAKELATACTAAA